MLSNMNNMLCPMSRGRQPYIMGDYQRQRIIEAVREAHASRLSERNERIREMYRYGLSTREIGRQIGLDCGQVYKICSDIARPHVNPDSKHWRTNRQRARRIMEKYLGRKLARNEHVHHINENFTDNRIENLEVKSATDHAKHHHPKLPGTNYSRHRDARVKQIAAWRRRNPDKMKAMYDRWNKSRFHYRHTCDQCSKPFIGLKKSIFCSRSCSAKSRWNRCLS